MSAHRSLAAVAALVLALPLGAQTKSPSKTTKQLMAACHVTATAPWPAKQNEWFAESKHDWSDDAMRASLLRAAAGELGVPPQLGILFDHRAGDAGPGADSVSSALLALAAQRGSAWPTRSVVGPAGVHAVYLLALRDTALGRATLHRMMEAGPAESPAADVAVLEDHMRLASNRKQIYGTQFRVNAAGKVELMPMEDSAHADLRREDASLPPLKVGICFAKLMAPK